MGPRPHDELALPGFGGAAVLPQAVEVGEGVCGVEVIPAAHVECGDSDVAPPFFVIDFVPVIVVGGVLNPVFPEAEVAPSLFVHFYEGEVTKGFSPVVVFDALGSAGGGAHAPGHEDVELKGTTGIDQPAEVVAADDARGKAGEILAFVRGALPLDQAQVRSTGHTNFAVAPFLAADPFLGVVAVFAFPERVVVALRVPAAATVLHRTDVATVGQPPGFFDHGINVIAVGGTHQDSGKFSRGSGEVDISGQINPVPHWDFYIQPHIYAVIGFHGGSF